MNGVSMLDSRDSMLDTGYSMLDTGYSMLVSREAYPSIVLSTGLVKQISRWMVKGQKINGRCGNGAGVAKYGEMGSGE